MKFLTGRYRTVILIVFAAFFVFSNTLVYAQVFTDVDDSHWAKEYIEKMNKVGIITGYSDATFRPEDSVTKVQALVMIGRMYELNEDKIKEIRTEYQEFFDTIGVETWYQDGLAVAISTGIVSKDVVETFYENKTANKPAYKEEICIYLTRAMGLENEAKNKTFYVLPFTDTETITPSAKPYVYTMMEKGIINKAGDGEGKFNPRAEVNRAIMAKMLSVAYDYIQEQEVTPEITEDKEEKTITITGTITDTMKVYEELYITIEEKNGAKNAYRVGSHTDIKLDDESADMSVLVEGMTVEAEVTEDRKVILIKGESINEEYTGKIVSLAYSDTNQIITVEYEKEDEDTEKKSFYVDEDADITLDGKEVFLYNLKKNDSVEIVVRNSKAVEIKATSKNRTIEGVIKEVSFIPEPVIVIEDKTGTVHEYSIDNEIDIERNGDDAEITELRSGDKVQLELEYDVITDIIAEVVRKEDEGTIKSILISKNPEITILNKDGDEVTYQLSSFADIEVDKETSDIYGLKLGYYVELKVEGNEIIELEADVRETSNRYEGRVSYVNNDAELIVLSVIDPVTNEIKFYTVTVSRDTSYFDVDGSKGRFSHIDKNDVIMVMGELSGDNIVARSIIMIEDNN
jgi:hypothetical protein